MTDKKATGSPRADKIEGILETNKSQSRYYDATTAGAVSHANGLATNAWRRIRRRGLGTVSKEARHAFFEAQKDWLGDLGGAKVLELGCGRGSYLSGYLASAAREYHAIDLSPVQVARLRKRIGARPNAHFHVGDFLSPDFTEGDFDAVYAKGVFHHFEHMDVFLDVLCAKLAPGARVVTRDPLQTWGPARMFRALYRPFQTDAAWEWPFGRETMALIEDRFTVARRVSLYRRAKWAVVLSLISPSLGRTYGDRWFRRDAAESVPREVAWSGLQLSYLLLRD